MLSNPEVCWLLFDGDCRICTFLAHAVDFVDVRRRICIRPIQESRELLKAKPEDEILDAMHAVSADGRVTTAHEAVLTILAALLDGSRLEDLLRGSPLVVAFSEWAYGFLVDFRGHLACRYRPLPVRD